MLVNIDDMYKCALYLIGIGFALLQFQLIFGMQPYFDPIRKKTSKKMEDDLKKKQKKWRRPQQKNKNEDDLKINKNEDDLKKK